VSAWGGATLLVETLQVSRGQARRDVAAAGVLDADEAGITPGKGSVDHVRVIVLGLDPGGGRDVDRVRQTFDAHA